MPLQEWKDVTVIGSHDLHVHVYVQLACDARFQFGSENNFEALVEANNSLVEKSVEIWYQEQAIADAKSLIPRIALAPGLDVACDNCVEEAASGNCASFPAGNQGVSKLTLPDPSLDQSIAFRLTERSEQILECRVLGWIDYPIERIVNHHCSWGNPPAFNGRQR